MARKMDSCSCKETSLVQRANPDKTYSHEYAPRRMNCRVPYSCLTGMLMALDWFQDIVFMFVPEERQIDVLMMNSEIHDGSIIGHTGRIIMLVCAAIGGSLPLTGMILYIRRKFFFRRNGVK